MCTHWSQNSGSCSHLPSNWCTCRPFSKCRRGSNHCRCSCHVCRSTTACNRTKLCFSLMCVLNDKCHILCLTCWCCMSDRNNGSSCIGYWPWNMVACLWSRCCYSSSRVQCILVTCIECSCKKRKVLESISMFPFAIRVELSCLCLCIIFIPREGPYLSRPYIRSDWCRRRI